jgi:hypothetical protein
MAKIKAADLESAVKDILADYADDVTKSMEKITKEITKKGVEAVKGESEAKFGVAKTRKKKYARTWTSKTESKVGYSTGTIYNTQPGLPHLLEYGHVTRNGTGRSYGQVAGSAHISTVEKELIRLFEEEVRAKI